MWCKRLVTIVTIGFSVAVLVGGGAAAQAASRTAASHADGVNIQSAAYIGIRPHASLYCGPQCRQALVLKASPSSVKCTVGVSWSATSFPYGGVSLGLSEKIAKAWFPHMKVIGTSANGSAITQASQVDDMVARGANVIVVSPADSAAIAPAVRSAEAKGVKVIASDRAVYNAPVATYISPDNVTTGRVAGKYIVHLLKGHGRVVELLGTLGASPTIDRDKGFRKAIAGTHIQLLGSEAANYDAADALKAMEDFLQRFPGKIDAVYSENDNMTYGALQALKAAGLVNKIPIVSNDGQAPALKLIKKGQLLATVVYPLTTYEHMLAAAKLCAGEPIQKRIVLKSVLVTRANANRLLGTTY